MGLLGLCVNIIQKHGRNVDNKGSGHGMGGDGSKSARIILLIQKCSGRENDRSVGDVCRYQSLVGAWGRGGSGRRMFFGVGACPFD